MQRGDDVIKKEMIAMLLAGGQGSRLGVLTKNVAKPAVSFGGKYSIIDFPLSNCINSGIDTVGVLTQYQPLRLNAHIGIGIPWDLDRNRGGVTVLQPYESQEDTGFYSGTANAIYQNIAYIENYDPEYVLILSGDHIYKMDYEVMIGGGGNGDHPSFMILTEAKKALAEMGITLTINDLSNTADLWNKLQARQAEMWCAAWNATPDPDMYQIYYSDIANGGKEPGGSNYMYQIEDPKLDEMILQARESTDQEYRKTMYKACLNDIIDWACEVPIYQRQEVTTFSSERINIDTITPDMTSFYKWYAEIQNYQLAK